MPKSAPARQTTPVAATHTHTLRTSPTTILSTDYYYCNMPNHTVTLHTRHNDTLSPDPSPTTILTCHYYHHNMALPRDDGALER